MTNYLGPLVIAEGFSAKHRHRGRVPLQAGTNQEILPASLGDSEPFKSGHKAGFAAMLAANLRHERLPFTTLAETDERVLLCGRCSAWGGRHLQDGVDFVLAAHLSEEVEQRPHGRPQA